MWNAVSEKATNDTDFSKYIIHYDYKAQQTGFVQHYADSPMDNEQVGEEVYISMINKADRKSTRLNSSHITRSRMPSSA